MPKKDTILISEYGEQQLLRFDEVCEICQLSSDDIYKFISYEIIKPMHNDHDEWFFNLEQLKRIKTAIRLQHDLEINLQGVALALELLDEIHRLRAKEQVFEKHYHLKLTSF